MEHATEAGAREQAARVAAAIVSGCKLIFHVSVLRISCKPGRSLSSSLASQCLHIWQLVIGSAYVVDGWASRLRMTAAMYSGVF